MQDLGPVQLSNRLLSRRTLLASGGVGTLSGCGLNETPSQPSDTEGSPYAPRRQAGVDRPQPRPAYQLTSVFRLTPVGDAEAGGATYSGAHSGARSGARPLARAVLAELGERVSTELGTGLAGGSAEQTITVGIGPSLVRLIDAPGVDPIPGARDLPSYPREDLAEDTRGGDLVVNLCGEDPAKLSDLARRLTPDGVRLAWHQAGQRGDLLPATGGQVSRNALGFVDGVIGPSTPEELTESVWLSDPTPLKDSTIAVFRRMDLDVKAFAKLSVAEQEAVFGRRKDTGAPLSGGTWESEPDLRAKTPAGSYLIPNEAHIRRAHSLATGVGMMLRRSYSYREPRPGLLFVSFQNSLETFDKTMARMVEGDALLRFTTTTATGTFLVLPALTSPTSWADLIGPS